jgi:hypothetical protein
MPVTQLQRRDRVQNRTLAAAAAALIVLLALDRYSYGHIGGEIFSFGPRMEVLPEYVWQRWATAALVLLLLAAVVALWRGSWVTSARLVGSEALLFVALNLAYLFRDGLSTRGFVGYEGNPQSLVVTVLGLLLRMALMLVLIRTRRKTQAVRA